MTSRSDRLQFSLIDNGEQRFITVVAPGRDPLIADDTHPKFDEIVQGASSGDESVVDLFDVAELASQKFQRLSERVTVEHGQVFFDGDPVDDSLTQQVVTFLDEDREDWKPLVLFYENVAANPSQNSREQLYDFLKQTGLRINDEGHIIAYKGVRKNGDGTLSSCHAGPGIVNGVRENGHLDNAVGNLVEMPRSAVVDDKAVACSVGLHVGTQQYARGFSQGALLEVTVNPRDVVSVPSDAAGEKVRVCRYRVTRELSRY